MSEEITIKVKYERQNQPKQFETSRAGIELEMTYPGTFTPEQIAQDGQALYQVAKSLVFQELGLPFEQNEVTGIILETFPGSAVVTMKPTGTEAATPAPATRRPAVRAVPNAPEPPYEPDPQEDAPQAPEPVTQAPRPRRQARPAPAPAAVDPDPDDLWEDLERYPNTWWDNRENKPNPKGPDFTSSVIKKADGYRASLWLNNAPDWFTLPEGPFRPSQSR